MTASKRISKRVDQILPRPQSKHTMKNGAGRISPIKGQKFTAAAITKYTKAQTARQTTPQSPTAWRFQTSLKRREPARLSWLEESTRANNQNDQIKPIDQIDQGKSAKAKRLVLFISKKSNDLSLQLEPLAKLHYRMPCVVFATR